MTTFFNGLPPAEVMSYKVSYDYRSRCSDGSYKWILMQTITIQSNDDGPVIRVLGVHADITHLKTDNTGSGLSFIGLRGAPSYHNVSVNEATMPAVSSRNVFSRREREVLKLVLEGKSSAGIAALLNVSIHTINTHRKNIFFKSNCRSLAELGAKVIREGWL